MGNCLSLRSSKLKEDAHQYRQPFFRDESIYANEDRGVWKKQHTPEKSLSSESIYYIEKETVLGKAVIKYELPIRPDEDSITDHYDMINDNDLRENDEDAIHCPIYRVTCNKTTHVNKGKGHNRPKPQRKTSDDDLYKEEKLKCLEFSEMVTIFKPLIVQNLIVHDILPHLPFLENHDDIYADVKNHSPKDAVVSLLNELNRSRELGKWQKFIDALNLCGYTYIVDNIRGYKFVSHEYQKEYLKKLTPKLSKMIEPLELSIHLYAKGLISDTDKENIEREENNRGPIAAAVLLLDRVTKKHRDWYKQFINCLIDAGRDDIAADLQIPELLEKNRIKDVDAYSYDDLGDALPPPSTTRDLAAMKAERGSECFHYKNEDENNEIEDTSLDHDLGYALPPSPPSTRHLAALKAKRVAECFHYKYEDENNEIEDDGGYEAYQDETEPPKLPPRVSLKGRPRYPLPYEGVSDSTNSYAKFDGRSAGVVATSTKIENEKEFQHLKEEIQNMEKEKIKLQYEVCLLEKKAVLNDDLNSGVKRRRELQLEIELKEKERRALETGPDDREETIGKVDAYSKGDGENLPFQKHCTENIEDDKEYAYYQGTFVNEKNTEEDKVDEYYPGTNNNKVISDDKTTDDYYLDDAEQSNSFQICGSWAKTTFDYRTISEDRQVVEPNTPALRVPKLPFLSIGSDMSLVQLYSPSFEQKDAILNRIEEDSGISINVSEYYTTP